MQRRFCLARWTGATGCQMKMNTAMELMTAGGAEPPHQFTASDGHVMRLQHFIGCCSNPGFGDGRMEVGETGFEPPRSPLSLLS